MMLYAAYATQIEQMLVLHLVPTFRAIVAYQGTSLTAKDASFAMQQLWKLLSKIQILHEIFLQDLSFGLADVSCWLF